MEEPMMEADIVGAIKIKDGLFIGDEFSAQDLEFVVTNKVTHILNCAGSQIPNHWEPIGVKYLTFYWLDNDQQVIFDSKDAVANDSFAFIEDAMAKTESTLVHSVRGQSRAFTIIASYFMRKYRWTLLKTFEFLSYRRPDLEIRSSFIQQLSGFESRLQKSGLGPKTSTWGEISELTHEMENEELVWRINIFILVNFILLLFDKALYFV